MAAWDDDDDGDHHPTIVLLFERWLFNVLSVSYGSGGALNGFVKHVDVFDLSTTRVVQSPS